jgi:putative ABC transport system permease protein
VTTLDNLLEESVGSRRLSTILLGLFGGLAMLLATIGVYAVMSYAVRMRTNEIGVRMALGARPGQIWWLVLDSGVRLVAAGMAIGIAGAFALTKLLAALLYEVTPTDPITFGAVALLLGGVALLACYMPARQAMRIEPMAALRTE